jgi:hypothetical protein
MSALFKPPNAADIADRKPPLGPDQLQPLGSKYLTYGSSAGTWPNAQSTVGTSPRGPLNQPQPGSSEIADTTPGRAQQRTAPRESPSTIDPFQAAAAKTQQSVRPDGGRRESRATIVPEALTSAMVVSLVNRATNAAMIGPRLFGDVMEGRLDPSSPEAIHRSFDTAATFVGGGTFGAGRGALGAAGGRLPPRFPGLVQPRNVPPATLGKAVSNDYRATFFKANPETEGSVWVHHAVPQHALKRYPNAFTEEELHSLENLRGIPLERNGEVHLSQIAKEWKAFYTQHRTASKQDLLNFATSIDGRFGHLFNPPIRELP